MSPISRPLYYAVKVLFSLPLNYFTRILPDTSIDTSIKEDVCIFLQIFLGGVPVKLGADRMKTTLVTRNKFIEGAVLIYIVDFPQRICTKPHMWFGLLMR